MNAGLSNLTTLKMHLLPDTWQTETSMDDILVAIGRGVAAQMEDYAGRKWQRAVGAQMTRDASARVVQLPRFPIEGTPTIALRSAGSSVRETQTDSLDNVAEEAGILYFTSAIGTDRDRLRITWTGGYWWDTADAPDDPEDMPAGATALPASLQMAWLLQCQHILAARELLAERTLPSGKASLAVAAEAQIELLKTVKDALQPFRILAA